MANPRCWRLARWSVAFLPLLPCLPERQLEPPKPSKLRDGDANRYNGQGCRRAAANIGHELNLELAGRTFEDQAELDRRMIALDGTINKSRLGANAILAVSVAFARAHALSRGVPLYQHFAEMLGSRIHALPRLTINLFSGGKHAGQQVSIQDVLIIPMSSQTIDEALVMASDVYRVAASLVFQKYGMRLLTADEGGLAPPFKTVEEMFSLAVESIEQAGYVPGKDFFLGVDVAATHFYKDKRYELDSRHFRQRRDDQDDRRLGQPFSHHQC